MERRRAAGARARVRRLAPAPARAPRARALAPAALGAALSLPLSASGSFAARPHRFYVEAGEGGDTVTAIVSSAELCSDGMSDRDYGWAVDFLRRDADGISGLTGCCMRPLD